MHLHPFTFAKPRPLSTRVYSLRNSLVLDVLPHPFDRPYDTLVELPSQQDVTSEVGLSHRVYDSMSFETLEVRSIAKPLANGMSRELSVAEWVEWFDWAGDYFLYRISSHNETPSRLTFTSGMTADLQMRHGFKEKEKFDTKDLILAAHIWPSYISLSEVTVGEFCYSAARDWNMGLIRSFEGGSTPAFSRRYRSEFAQRVNRLRSIVKDKDSALMWGSITIGYEEIEFGGWDSQWESIMASYSVDDVVPYLANGIHKVSVISDLLQNGVDPQLGIIVAGGD